METFYVYIIYLKYKMGLKTFCIFVVTMTKNQLYNLIYFCGNFSSYMDSKLEDHNAEYILEKWNKYIGVKPIKNDNLPTKEYIISNGFIDKRIKIWVDRWSRNNEYDEVKEILHFITIVNSRTFSSIIKEKNPDLYWTPSELLNEIRKVIPNVNEINKEAYTHLHEILKMHINEWLEEERRDFNLCQLIKED
jgi:hypothetical protein